jgi:ribose-phosphate pyrophosphokinase
MIKVDNITIEANQFPDHTLLVKAPTLRGHGEWVNITWNYENDAELFTLICLRKHYSQAKAILWLEYCPHARMDRVKVDSDVFTLKYFAEVINSLNFARVNILDPHSSVCTALINNVRVLSPKEYIIRAIEDCQPDLLFYPDEGAMKRYSEMVAYQYSFGIKKRDWTTGKIEGLDVAGCIDKIRDSKILIVDDICSKGTTFYYAGQKLKELGASDIRLYITHCEDNIQNGEILKTDVISKIYTTDSICHIKNEKIDFIRTFRL